MGSNTLTPVSSPVSTDDIDQHRTASLGDWMPRNASSGAIEGKLHSLGSAAVPWLGGYLDNLYLGGVLFDPTGSGGEVDTSNAIVSSATRTTSAQPDFLRASGAAATVTILATTTDLVYTANGTTATISADLAVTSLTVAPAANNTCLVDDINLADEDSTKFLGEEGTSIPVDAMGSELTSRVGQYVCLKTANNEYMLAFIESTTKLSKCYRGYFLDSSAAPVFRDTLADNDTLTLMSLGWVFADADGTTIDVSYVSPLYEDTEPASGTTDDYWFNQDLQQWNRYSGAAWIQVDRMLLGLAVIDTTNCVASRSFDITQGYFDHNTVECELFSTTQVYSKQGRSQLSVYGNTFYYDAHPIIWDIANDLESPLTEQASTVYYLYITETGEHKISDKRPYDRRSNLKGYYHPHNTWLCVGIAFNDGSSNLTDASTFKESDPFIASDFLSSTADWNNLTTAGLFKTSGTTYSNAPLFDTDTTGFLVIRTINGDTSLIQEWYQADTGDKWLRAYDGTNWTMWDCISSNPQSVFIEKIDFERRSALDTRIQEAYFGSGANGTYPSDGDIRHRGLYEIDTGTTAGGRGDVLAMQRGVQHSAVSKFYRCEFIASIETLSDGTNGFETAYGIFSAGGSGIGASANTLITFLQEDSVNSGNWVCRTDNAGTQTDTNTSVAPTADVFQKFRIETNRDATEVKFFIDDVLVATHTTNIPTTPAFPLMGILKTSGTSTRSLFLDLIYRQMEK